MSTKFIIKTIRDLNCPRSRALSHSITLLTFLTRDVRS